MEMGRKGTNWFSDCFGKTMGEVGQECGVSREAISQVFRVESCSRELADSVVRVLARIRDENLRNEIKAAQDHFARANEIIDEINRIGHRVRRTRGKALKGKNND